MEKGESAGLRLKSSIALATCSGEKLEADDPALRKAYVRLIVGKVGLGDDQITICGSKLALEHALVRGDRHPGEVVPSFDRKWCRRGLDIPF